MKQERKTLANWRVCRATLHNGELGHDVWDYWGCVKRKDV
jgi:hypothetical protein